MQSGVIGGTGYLGAELLRILAAHPVLDVVAVQGNSASGSAIGDIYPTLASAYPTLAVDPVDVSVLDGLEVIFVAVPSGSSQEIVSSLLGQHVGTQRAERGPLVVDLGADFRLKKASEYPQWYGFEHLFPELLETATCGLPELYRSTLPGAALVAAPGCYVTAASLALAPFARRGLIVPTGVIVDAASGTSGAGKTPSEALHHPRVNEAFTAYGLLDHRHTPEMEQMIGTEILFTPHLAPMTRGILATCYARPATGLDGSLSSTDQALEILEEAYRDEPFVHVTRNLVSTGDAYGSNVCHMTARVDRRTGWLVVLSAIDNLLKGGSGQAIQAANVALDLTETAGLPLIGLAP
jgi:N-acetyl-gamma-glutamyl-phosphate reductase